MPGKRQRKSKRTGKMESGISDEWGVVRVDEDQERKKEHNEKIYLQYKETFDRNAKKWDLANPERKRKIKQSYEERNKGRRYMHPYYFERDRINAYQRERRRKIKEQKKAMDKRKKVICIYGRSGCGKSFAANFLHEHWGIHIVCSSTTRPMRPGEVHDVDHKFVKGPAPKEGLVTYTQYGGYEYWATEEDFVPGINVYVVDELGIMMMQKNPNFRLFPIKITASEGARRKRKVSLKRIIQDYMRFQELPELTFRPFRKINNSGPRTHIKKELSIALAQIMEK